MFLYALQVPADGVVWAYWKHYVIDIWICPVIRLHRITWKRCYCTNARSIRGKWNGKTIALLIALMASSCNWYLVCSVADARTISYQIWIYSKVNRQAHWRMPHGKCGDYYESCWPTHGVSKNCKNKNNQNYKKQTVINANNNNKNQIN